MFVGYFHILKMDPSPLVEQREFAKGKMRILWEMGKNIGQTHLFEDFWGYVQSCVPCLRATFAVHFCGPLLRAMFAVHFCVPWKRSNVGMWKRPGRHGHFSGVVRFHVLAKPQLCQVFWLKFWKVPKTCMHTPPPSGGVQNPSQDRELRQGPNPKTGVSGIYARFENPRKRPKKWEWAPKLGFEMEIGLRGKPF